MRLIRHAFLNQDRLAVLILQRNPFNCEHIFNRQGALNFNRN